MAVPTLAASPFLFWPLAHLDQTWTYSFSGAFLFSVGFLFAGLCYLSYRYITKPHLPPNSLVSRGPREDGEAEGRARALGPRLSLISPSSLKMWLAAPPVYGRELGIRKRRH